MNERIEIELNNTTYFVRRLTVQQVHDVGETLYADERRMLVDDAEAAGLNAEERLEKIQILRESWANGVELLRQAYTRKGAIAYLEAALEPEDIDLSVLEEERDMKCLIRAAVAVCGLPDPFDDSNTSEINEDEDAEEIWDDRDEGQSAETGTMKQP